MTTTSASARAHARAVIERALITDKGRGGLAASFDYLEERLRRHAPDLNEQDRDDIRAYINARVDGVFELLGDDHHPERIWTSEAEFGVAIDAEAA